MGLLRATFEELREEGTCVLVDDREKYDDHMAWTIGDPCHGLVTRGHPPCERLREGQCPAYRRFHTSAQLRQAGQELAKAAKSDQGFGGKWAGKTIRQVAAEEGISLSEARRRKAAGAYLG